MPGRDLIMCSPTGSVGVGDATTITMTISEPGKLKLSNLVLSAGFNTAVSASSANCIDQLNISSALINGAIELIRGRNTLAAPAGAFSAYRGIRSAIGLPDIHVQAGDTFAVTLGSESTNTGAINISMACAFSPDNVRESTPEPRGPSVYASSVVDQIAANTDGGSAAWTADESGILSLTSMQFRGYIDLAAAGAAAGDWADCTVYGEISALTLPSGNALVLGQGTPILNGTFFGAGQRSYSWFQGGAVRVSGGDQITYTINNTGPDAANFSWGARFYPDKFRGYDGCK